jgi:hypothetical protein
MAILVALDLNKLIMKKWRIKWGTTQKEKIKESGSFKNAKVQEDTSPPMSEAIIENTSGTPSKPPEPPSTLEASTDQNGGPDASESVQPGDDEEAIND